MKLGEKTKAETKFLNEVKELLKNKKYILSNMILHKCP